MFGRAAQLAAARRGLRMAAWREVVYGDAQGSILWFKDGIDCLRGRADDVLRRRGLPLD